MTTSRQRATTPADHVHRIVDRLFRAVEQRDATSYLTETYHPEVTISESPALPYGGDYHGPEGVVQHAGAFLATWSPHQDGSDRTLRARIDAVPDHAYVSWQLGVAGRRFEAISHYRLRDGLIIEATMFYFDLVGLLSWWQTLHDGAGHPDGHELSSPPKLRR